MSVGGSQPFGLNDVTVTNIGATADADLPAAQTLTFNPRINSAELSGDDKIAAVSSRVVALDWELEAGGIDLDAYAIITGYTVASSGTTPSQQDELQFDGAKCLPYFSIFGKALGSDCTDDIHVLIYKAKCTQMEGQLKDGEFFITKCKGVAIDGGTHGIVEIIQHETAASLPAV